MDNQFDEHCQKTYDCERNLPPMSSIDKNALTEASRLLGD